MEFRKKIDIPKSDINLNHQSGIVLFGSCFAEHIGARLLENKFQVHVNPFGVLYNPASIEQAIHILLDETQFSEPDIFESQGVYHTFFHHSRFSDTDIDVFLENINRKRKQATEDIKKADVLLITFGTAYVFKYKETGSIVANCHKLPASAFEHYRLHVEETTELWDKLIIKIRKINPSLKILFTVSPVRHWKDGAHNNQLSKAILLLTIENLSCKHKEIYYFPSYEILLDELRDYRFYSDDMIHPNDMAIRYIWEVFSNTFFSEETLIINSKWQNILKAINHRPFNERTEEHKHFLRQTLLKINDLRNKYPYFDCKNEIDFLSDKLTQS